MLFPRFRLRYVPNLLFHVGFHTYYMMINRVYYLQKWENKPSCWKRKWNWIAVLPTFSQILLFGKLRTLTLSCILYSGWWEKWVGNTVWKATTHVPKSTDYNNKSYCLLASKRRETFFTLFISFSSWSFLKRLWKTSLRRAVT